MNQVTNEKKEAITKTLAIIGFFAAIVFAVWLAVQIVSVLPNAFSSLASLAEGVYNYRPNETMTLTSNPDIVNSGEGFAVSWDKIHRPGSYSFSYACTDNVSVGVRINQGPLQSVACNTSFDLGSDTTANLSITSTKDRFVDVPYTISFVPENKNDTTISTQGTVTVVNATVNVAATTPATTTTTPTQPTTPAPATPKITPTKTAQHVVYTYPASNPNGTVDLQVTYNGIGLIEGTNFTRVPTLHAGQPGAYQFIVKNTGTKTASTWSYIAHLPGGQTYNAGPQTPLQPNETAYITIGFQALTNPGPQTFGATIGAPDDVNLSNNSFGITTTIAP